MTTAIVVVAFTAALGILLLIVHSHLRARSDRRLELVLSRIDGHMEAISERLSRAVDRLDAVRASESGRLTLDFDELLDTLLSTAIQRTGARAAVVRIVGTDGRPLVASFGMRDRAAIRPEATVGPPDARRFRAATIDWTYGATEEADDDAFRSALVVPLSEEGEVTGTLAVYASVQEAFTSEHARTLIALVDETTPRLATARHFATIEARGLIDLATGLRNHTGYEIELSREVERARRTGRPLSVVLLGLGADAAEGLPSLDDGALREVATILARVTRATDIPCRRGDRELAVVLPETRGAGADKFTTRLRAEARGPLARAGRTLSVGLVEWRPSETFESLDARVASSIARATAEVRASHAFEPAAAGDTVLARASRARDDGLDMVPAHDLRRLSARAARSHILAVLSRQIEDARRLGHPLALLMLDVDDFGRISDRIGTAAAAAVLDAVARCLDECGRGGRTLQVGPDEFVVVLSGSTVDDAESMLGIVQASLHGQPPQEGVRVTLSAGITELTGVDDARGVLDRVEHALWQAKQAGRGTVVIALTNHDPAS